MIAGLMFLVYTIIILGLGMFLQWSLTEWKKLKSEQWTPLNRRKRVTR